MKFTIDDGDMEDLLNINDVPPGVRKIKETLDNLEDGKLYRTRKVAYLAGCSHKYMASHSSHPILKPYRVEGLKKPEFFYGNPRTIEAYKKQREEKYGKEYTSPGTSEQ